MPLTFEEFNKSTSTGMFNNITKKQKDFYFSDCFLDAIDQAKSVLCYFESKFPENKKLRSIIKYCKTCFEKRSVDCSEYDKMRHSILLIIYIDSICPSNGAIHCASYLMNAIYHVKNFYRNSLAKSNLCASIAWARITKDENKLKDKNRGLIIFKEYNFMKQIFYQKYCSIFKPENLKFKKEWKTSDCVNLAKGICNDRAFDRMPILADALQDAGFKHEDTLKRLREGNEFTAADWILFKLIS